jgi:GNAT superfamily N-acetyltransferase
MVEVRIEAFSKAYPEMVPHLRQQHEENETFVDGIDLAPAVETYKALEAKGDLSVLVAREAGKMVGYLVLLTFPDLHHEGYKVAQQDVMYVAPGKRGSGIALSLLGFAEKVAKMKGATWFRITMKNKQRFDDLLKAIDMVKDEVTYAKRIV